MKIATGKRPVAQGDVLFRRIKKLPENVGPEQAPVNGKLIVTHSETGHHHTTRADMVRLYGEQSALVAYLVAESAYADIEHERPWDTHEPLRLPKGIWEIRRQREHTPEGWQRVAD